MTPIRRVLQVLMLLLLVCSTSLLSAQESEVTPEVTESLMLAPETVTPEPTDPVVTEVLPTAEPVITEVPPTAEPVVTEVPPTAEPVQPDNVAPTPTPNTVSAALSAPRLRTPRRDTVLTDRTPTFTWNAVIGARRYVLQLYNEAPMLGSPGTLHYSSEKLSGTSFTLPRNQRLPNGTYYWTVTAFTTGAESPASNTRRFIIRQPTSFAPPIAVDDSYALESGDTISAPGVLSNDTPYSGSISAVNGSTSLNGVPTEHGSVTVAADGSFTYIAADGYLGQDSFTYTITNPGGSATATVVLLVGVRPVAVNDTYEILAVSSADELHENLTLGLNPDHLGSPAATVVSFGGGSIYGTAAYLNTPNWFPIADGRLRLAPDGTLTLIPWEQYLPEDAFPLQGGVYTFYYRLKNAIGYSDGAVQITVCGPNYREQAPCDDFDQDGIPDTWEVKWFGNLAQNLLDDPDADGCSNECEIQSLTSPVSADTDNDGLTDNEEISGVTAGGITYYANPRVADTDSDGLKDGEEINGTYPSDPMLEDTDGDFYNDRIEALYQSDPRDAASTPDAPDADGDTLLDQWEFQYFGNLKQVAWQDPDRDGCSNRFEVQYALDPTDPDWDDDGLEDGDEVHWQYTDPKNPDTDGDTLSDGDEVYAVLGYPTYPLYADSDNDGLTDNLEYVYHTLPRYPDYDSDGLLDGTEIYGVTVTNPAALYTSNPLEGDTDGDHLGDSEEVRAVKHSDPTRVDTDSDGLSDEHEARIYRLHPSLRDTDQDGFIDSYELVRSYLNPINNQFYRTEPNNPDSDGDGLGDREEVYQYGSNPTMADTDQDGVNDNQDSTDGQPDSYGLDEDGDRFPNGTEGMFGSDPHNRDSIPPVEDTDADSVFDAWEMQFYGQLTIGFSDDTDNDRCSTACEWVYGSNPTNPDSDSDGLQDSVELFSHRTNPANADSDGDNLQDRQEVTLYQTNPLSVDTDDDGLQDGAEVSIYGTNPLSYDSDTDGLSDADELFIYHTLPLNPDTDGDGFDDGTEASCDSDPLDPRDTPF